MHLELITYWLNNIICWLINKKNQNKLHKYIFEFHICIFYYTILVNNVMLFIIILKCVK